MSERIATAVRSTCVTDNLSSYFAGKASLENALQDTAKAFVDGLNRGTFVCSLCGNIIYPKVTTNEHGIFIESNRTEVRGAHNSVIKENICANCCKIASEV